MPPEDDDDLYDGDFEFVDDDDEDYEDSDEFDSEIAEEEEVEEEVVEKKPKKKAKKKAPKAAPAKKKKAAPKRKRKPAPKDEVAANEEVEENTDEAAAENDVAEGDEYGRTEPEANYVVHVYELKKLKRTIDRKFTPEDAEAFVTEYNRTSKSYNRWAVPGKDDVQPGKMLAQ